MLCSGIRTSIYYLRGGDGKRGVESTWQAKRRRERGRGCRIVEWSQHIFVTIFNIHEDCTCMVVKPNTIYYTRLHTRGIIRLLYVCKVNKLRQRCSNGGGAGLVPPLPLLCLHIHHLRLALQSLRMTPNTVIGIQEALQNKWWLIRVVKSTLNKLHYALLLYTPLSLSTCNLYHPLLLLFLSLAQSQRAIIQYIPPALSTDTTPTLFLGLILMRIRRIVVSTSNVSTGRARFNIFGFG